MKASPAEVLAAFLVDLGLVTRPATGGGSIWPVTTGVLPEDTDNRVVITNVDSEIQGKNFRTGETFLSPICQIRVRSVPASVGFTKIKDILAVLTPISGVQVVAKVPEVETLTLVAVNLVSGPSYMGQDEKNQRQHHVMNVKVIVVPGE